MAEGTHFIRIVLKWTLLLGFFFVVAGVAAVVFERMLIPRLVTYPALERLSFLKRATENVTVINKTEQVVIREDDSVERVVSQPATAVVSIIAVGEKTIQRTGILLTNDGLLVTYVSGGLVEGTARATILLFDGSSHPARFVGLDPLTNLAYYRIEGVNTPAIALANSDDTRVGRKLVAIGNATVEYQNRLSVGILGNKNRTFNLSGKTVASSEKWEGVFEMDVPQAEAFVGGPAVGFNGEMVGIVGMETLDATKHFFLIPANSVRMSLQLAITNGLTNRPTLGVYYLPITKAYSIANDLSRDRGALIYSPSGKTGLAVLSGSPADKAGLRNGDIVIAVEGEEINLDNPLSVVLGRFSRGDTVKLLLFRNSVETEISVTL